MKSDENMENEMEQKRICYTQVDGSKAKSNEVNSNGNRTGFNLIISMKENVFVNVKISNFIWMAMAMAIHSVHSILAKM